MSLPIYLQPSQLEENRCSSTSPNRSAGHRNVKPHPPRSLERQYRNADTPGYRARDLDFEPIMRSAAETREISAADRERPMDELSAAPLELRSAIYETEFPDHPHGEERLDGNSVSLDRQMGLMTENALAYEASLTLPSRTLAGLRYAISEGKI